MLRCVEAMLGPQGLDATTDAIFCVFPVFLTAVVARAVTAPKIPYKASIVKFARFFTYDPLVLLSLFLSLFCSRYDTIAEGIGNDHVTGNFARAVLDDAFKITDQEAVYMAHYLLRHEGELHQLLRC